MNRNPAIHRQPSGDIDIAVIEVTAAPEPGHVVADAHPGLAPARTTALASSPPRSAEPAT
ncbi:hypothetical protein [Frankia sp. QA3]|uniref:hypothetical protein n=1 Tax=Frankia sp. QA3 TaxID=710111 RepID=UPI000269C289|nr:hypothetical protein [Frankia sp. QA3]EIV90956.1 hypothetical protein FraQA3DRAFT_0372 [Frankia sp. QA3]